MVARFPAGAIRPFSAFHPLREVMPMYVTWDLLFLFAGFILSLLAYVDSHNKKD